MTNERRIEVYTRGKKHKRLTPKQRRRVQKYSNRLKGGDT